MRWLFGIVDIRPFIASAKPIRLAIVMSHAMVVLYAVLQKKLGTFFARFPPWCHGTTGRFANELGEQLVRVVQDFTLLI